MYTIGYNDYCRSFVNCYLWEYPIYQSNVLFMGVSMRKYIEACKCGGEVFLCRDYTRFGLSKYRCECNGCKTVGNYACESLDAYKSFVEILSDRVLTDISTCANIEI